MGEMFYDFLGANRGRSRVQNLQKSWCCVKFQFRWCSVSNLDLFGFWSGCQELGGRELSSVLHVSWPVGVLEEVWIRIWGTLQHNRQTSSWALNSRYFLHKYIRTFTNTPHHFPLCSICFCPNSLGSLWHPMVLYILRVFDNTPNCLPGGETSPETSCWGLEARWTVFYEHDCGHEFWMSGKPSSELVDFWGRWSFSFSEPGRFFLRRCFLKLSLIVEKLEEKQGMTHSVFFFPEKNKC